jgi:UDPglucose--hexose-1-phosphate uridylyltransferase
MTELFERPHRRLNLLTGEWVLVSPHRGKRPWQGKVEKLDTVKKDSYDAACYLCPGNKRAGDVINPDYQKPFSFINDFSALLPLENSSLSNEENLLITDSENGICKVICFSPRHDLTLAQMEVDAIVDVVGLWKSEYEELQKNQWLKYIQIFENKGELMGCSNPHPHGQIWASENIPNEIEKETVQQKKYFQKHNQSLLLDYVELELKKNERIVCVNEHFVALVPFWAIWPYEIMIVSKRHVQNITQFSNDELKSLAAILKVVTTKYDNIFNTSFPYSAGMHQAPVNDGEHEEWHWHMHFYPPLLRSATVKKFMVGYEMLASPQRDITPEWAAEKLKNLSDIHYTHSL